MRREEVMNVLEEVVMPYNTGKSCIVKKGQRIRIIAESIVDCVPFNLDNMRERFDQARTKVHNGKIYLSTGDKLYTKFARHMMTIGEDTYNGTHDLEFGMCSKLSFDRYYEQIKSGDPSIMESLSWPKITKRGDLPDHGCWENLQDALKGYDVALEDIPSPFNLFQSMDISGPDGKMVWHFREVEPPANRFRGGPAHVDLVAEMNCLVALSACPERGQGKPVKVQVFDE
jgi:uncharacterized protein YcgI (DUF1989 family)